MGYGDAVDGGSLTRAHAAGLDRADPLAGFRERFELGDGDRIYLDGNSLGRLSHDARAALQATVDEWGSRLVTGWHDWVDLAGRAGDALGAAALGAGPGQALACDSTTVNLYKLAGAALAAREGSIVVPADDFPTDRYVLEGLAAAHGRELRLLEGDPVAPLGRDAVAAAAEGAALVVLSHVNYRSGALADMAAITPAVQAAGALVLWDLCHSAGAVDVNLDAAGADLAVGCTYKYLNGGPGAPAYLYIRGDLQAQLRNPIQGWFGQADQFEMGQGFRPQPGIAGWLTGTPGILGLAAAEEGIRLSAEAGIERIRAKGVALTEYAIALHDAHLAPLGFELGSPRDAARRGAHVSIRRADARELTRRMIAAGIVPDFRAPDSIRLGLSPLTTTFGEVHRAIERIAELAAG